MSNNYTIYAEKGIQFQEKLAEILKSLEPSEYELIRMDLDGDSIITVLNELEAAPFLYDLRVVLLENPSLMMDKSVDDRLVDQFNRFLENPVETTTLITLVTPEDERRIKKGSEDGEDSKVSKSKKDMAKKLKDLCNVITLGAFTAKDADSIIERELVGYTIANRAKEELKSRVNHDMTRLIVEIEKLKLYKLENKNITEDDILLMVSRDLEDKAYNLSSAIIAKKRNEALLLMSDLKKSGSDSNTLLQAILSKLEEMYQTKVFATSGMSKDDIAAYFGYKPGRVHFMMQDASKYSLDKIKDEINKLTFLEYDTKRGRRNIDQALEIYILSL